MKRIFPSLWFGFLGVFVAVGIGAGANDLIFLLAPIALGIFGFFLFTQFVWDMADNVYDCGEHLIFQRGKVEQKVPLSEVINVSHSGMSTPERITLTVRIPGDLGCELTFCPPSRLNPFSKSPIFHELIRRIDAART